MSHLNGIFTGNSNLERRNYMIQKQLKLVAVKAQVSAAVHPGHHIVEHLLCQILVLLIV